MTDSLIIRPAQPTDVPRLQELSEQLGYAASQEVITKHLAIIIAGADEILLVAELDGLVVGWTHIYIRYLITDASNIEIGGLVVDENCRSQGVGAALVRHAEEWARSRGIEEVFVRSNIKRERAHQFYLRNGYTLRKTSYTFHKVL